MKTYLHSALLATGVTLALAAGHAAASVDVNFVRSWRYADMPTEVRNQQQVLHDLKAHFEKLAAQLPTGDVLKVEVLNIDLTGHIDPVPRGDMQMRVLNRAAELPVIQLRYSIESDGKVLASGESTIAKTDYSLAYPVGDGLRYEKTMLDNWFKTLSLK